MSSEQRERLIEKATVREQPFRSPTPVVGPLIARFRHLWNSVATRWYVRPLLDQQNEYNRLLADRLHQLADRMGEQDRRMLDQAQILIEQDREQTALTHDLAEVAAQLTQTNRLLASIDERLARLEARQAEAEQ